LSWSGTYTADATTLDITWAKRFKGACKDSEANDYGTPFSFVMSMFTTPGAWSVTGDTLTLKGTEGPAAGQEYQLPRATP
jgi:hypothetical protein